MVIKRRKGWEVPEREVTPEHVYWNRRAFMGGSLGTALTLAACGEAPSGAGETRASDVPKGEVPGVPENDPTMDLYPAERNGAYTVSRPITSPDYASRYNNFYEFGSHKRIWKEALNMKTRPWTVKIDGEVEEEKTLDIDTIIRQAGLEERVYRLRCVEAWAMTVPWTGFALSKLIEMARPTSAAKFVRMETLKDPDVFPGQRFSFGYPWPYVEGLTMEEAMNDLSFMVTGVYGKPIPGQHGAPLRLAVPWKYGFKSIKSIVRLSFTREMPKSFWMEVQGREYGFWANVNPDVPHPRWSQKMERLLGEDREVPTRLFNGYGEFVSHLYKDMNLPDTVLYR